MGAGPAAHDEGSDGMAEAPTTDELAGNLADWLRVQPGVTEVEVLADFGAEPVVFIGQAFLGFLLDGVGMSLSLAVTE